MLIPVVKLFYVEIVSSLLYLFIYW